MKQISQTSFTTAHTKQIIIEGDNQTVLANVPDNTYDTLITDPPYGLKFQNRVWDYDIPSVEFWRDCLRVLKPGATALIFAGTKTQHRMMVNVEDAGFVLADCLMWIYGSGYPKTRDISKEIDKSLGIRRPAHKLRKGNNCSENFRNIGDSQTRPRLIDETLPASPLAQHWDGWYSHNLKPAYEPIIVAFKPNTSTYIDNATKYQVAGLNIGGCRDAAEACPATNATDEKPRFPANVLIENTGTDTDEPWHRYFYCPKVSRKERGADNTHPTVKPIDLMAHLVRLTKTPTGGSVLDPFAGSGTTGVACKMEDRFFLGIEREPEFVAIARSRIETV